MAHSRGVFCLRIQLAVPAFCCPCPCPPPAGGGATVGLGVELGELLVAGDNVSVGVETGLELELGAWLWLLLLLLLLAVKMVATPEGGSVSPFTDSDSERVSEEHALSGP